MDSRVRKPVAGQLDQTQAIDVILVVTDQRRTTFREHRQGPAPIQRRGLRRPGRY
jgi:hypothetical protein